MKSSEEIRKIIEVINELTADDMAASGTDISHIKPNVKSHTVPHTPEGQLRELIHDTMDELFAKIGQMKNLKPEVRQEVEEHMLRFVAFVRTIH